MVKIKTSSGFECELDEAFRDDFELLENLVRPDKGDPSVLTDVINGIFGEAKPALYEHCRKENGRVSTMAVMQEVRDVFSSVGGELKN